MGFPTHWSFLHSCVLWFPAIPRWNPPLMQDPWLRTISIGCTGAFLCGIVVADEPLQLPGGVEIVEVDFERHVSSLLGLRRTSL